MKQGKGCSDLKQKAINTIKEALGYLVTGIGAYYIFFNGVTLSNVALLSLGITLVFLHLPLKRKQRDF